MDIFLNIIVLFSPNYDNKIVLGTTNKSIKLIDQFKYFYNSIKKNLNTIKYDISIVYFDDFNNDDITFLNSLEVNLLKINTNDIRICALNRYIVNTPIKGTHRLLCETDMLLMNEPFFNWNVDFQAMYAGNIYFNNTIINKFIKDFNINKLKKFNLNKNRDLFVSYVMKKKDKLELFPHFNNGLILIKEDFARIVYNKLINSNFINYIDSNFKNNKNICHLGPQVIISILTYELTDNWEPFKPGINYLLKSLDVNIFNKNNITLIHYCGINAGSLVKKIYPEYFK